MLAMDEITSSRQNLKKDNLSSSSKWIIAQVCVFLYNYVVQMIERLIELEFRLYSNLGFTR